MIRKCDLAVALTTGESESDSAVSAPPRLLATAREGGGGGKQSLKDQDMQHAAKAVNGFPATRPRC